MACINPSIVSTDKLKKKKTLNLTCKAVQLTIDRIVSFDFEDYFVDIRSLTFFSIVFVFSVWRYLESLRVCFQKRKSEKDQTGALWGVAEFGPVGLHFHNLAYEFILPTIIVTPEPVVNVPCRHTVNVTPYDHKKSTHKPVDSATGDFAVGITGEHDHDVAD